MNKFFDFSPKQLQVLGIISSLLLLIAIFEFIQAYAIPSKPSPKFQVFVGEQEQKIVGTFQLDPNLAPVDSLELLPGVGKIIADRIDDYRQTNRFNNVIDITNVKGIGPKLYERLKPYLKVDTY